MRTSTRSGNSATSEARSEAHEGSGASRVPRSASVRRETLNSGPLCSRVSRMDEMRSCSVLPIYSVERYILLFPPWIFFFNVS